MAVGLIVALLVAPAAWAQSPTQGAPASEPLACELGLALSGGGGRGIAHIGVLRAFEEEGIAPDCVAGTSMGALIGALYASGYDSRQIEAFVKEAEWQGFYELGTSRLDVERALVPLAYRKERTEAFLHFDLDIWGVRFHQAAFGDYRIHRFLTRLLAGPNFAAGRDFTALPLPFHAVAMDLETGERVVLSSGSLAQAVRASTSVPLLLPPVEIDDRLFVDGGLVDNVPVDVAFEMGAERVVAVDTTTPPEPLGDDRDLLSVANRLSDVMALTPNRLHWREPDVLIAPDLQGHPYTRYDNFDFLIEQGYRAAREMMAEIRAARGLAPAAGTSPAGEVMPTTTEGNAPPSSGTGAAAVPVRDVPGTSGGGAPAVPAQSAEAGDRAAGAVPGQGTAATGNDAAPSSDLEGRPISHVQVEGSRHVDATHIITDSGLQPGEPLRLEDAVRGTDVVFASGLFQTVWVDFFPGEGAAVVPVLYVEEEDRLTLDVGLAFDDEDKAKGLVRLVGRNLLTTGEISEIEVRGSDRETALEIAFLSDNALRRGLGFRFAGSIERAKPRFFVAGQFVNRAEFLRIGLQGATDLAMTRYSQIEIGLRVGDVEVRERLGLDFTPVTHRQRLLSGAFELDTLDRIDAPTNGSRVTLALQKSSSGLGASLSYWKAWLEARRAVSVRRGHVVDGRVLAGLSGGELPVYEQFRIGGPLWVPGLNREELWNDQALALSLSYSYLLGSGLRLTATAGGGGVWADRDAIAFDDLGYGIGIGAWYSTPVGPISLGYGVAEGGNGEFYVALGYQ